MVDYIWFLIPSLIGTMFIILGIGYVLYLWISSTWGKYNLWKEFKANKIIIDYEFVLYRVRFHTPGWHELSMWLKQEERLLNWLDKGSLIPVQLELIDFYRNSVIHSVPVLTR